MKRCRHAKDYKGIHPPKCNGGEGCDECNRTFQSKCEHPVLGFVVEGNFVTCSRCKLVLRWPTGSVPTEFLWNKIYELVTEMNRLRDNILDETREIVRDEINDLRRSL